MVSESGDGSSAGPAAGRDSTNTGGLAARVSCRVCGHLGDGTRYLAREMMHGLREEFAYVVCGGCGCLQIETVPQDLSPYYPGSYHSFAAPQDDGLLKRTIKRKRTQHLLGRRSLLGSWALRRFGAPRWAEWVQRTGTDLHDPVLDVGCGAGHLLRQMRDAGFDDLTGIDPFITTDSHLDGGLRLLKRDLQSSTGEYHLVMLHHSFEHMPDPRSALIEIRRLLRQGGTALIRIPVFGSEAWEIYGTDWVQLDAPRHLHLHTERSLELLAEATGFQIAEIVYDSTAFQFWGSEQYRRDIPLTSAESYAVDPDRSIFGVDQIADWEARSRELNESRRGDSVCVYLKAAGSPD